MKSGRKISFSNLPRPREGDVVYFTQDEWRYIKEKKFSHLHKDYLWEQKHRNFRYEIIPKGWLTEPGVAATYLESILERIKKKRA